MDNILTIEKAEVLDDKVQVRMAKSTKRAVTISARRLGIKPGTLMRILATKWLDGRLVETTEQPKKD